MGNESGLPSMTTKENVLTASRVLSRGFFICSAKYNYTMLSHVLMLLTPPLDLHCVRNLDYGDAEATEELYAEDDDGGDGDEDDHGHAD